MSLPKKIRGGDTLIGIIIALGIFLILSQAVITLALSVYDLISYSRARISARHIALESVEIIRNTDYELIGTIGGIPAGIFPQSQQVQRNGQSYEIRTSIVYIDDPFDGLFPSDTLPTDYKRVRIDVSWGGVAASRFSEVTFVTDVAPRGIETIEGGGTLTILVFDANGIPIPQARVEIVATETSPPVDTFYFTSDTGRVTLPGAPVCNSCYSITVSKDGMSTDRTYTIAEVTNPTKPPVSVLEGQLTETSFSIDRFARLKVNTFGSFEDEFPPLGNQIIRIRGEKTIGTTGDDEPVYKFDQEIVTSPEGELIIEELEWDNYHVSLPGDSTVEIAGIYPPTPLSIAPTSEVNLLLSLVEDNLGSILIRFEDSLASPIASVEATLKDSENFEASASSGIEGAPNFGQVFFDGLENKLYTLIATASGFLEHSVDILIVGDISERVILTPE